MKKKSLCHSIWQNHRKFLITFNNGKLLQITQVESPDDASGLPHVALTLYDGDIPISLSFELRFSSRVNFMIDHRGMRAQGLVNYISVIKYLKL